MTKKMSVNDLRGKISKIVKEEIDRALNEQENPHFSRIRDKDKFVSWVMRQYFDPDKHSDKVWFKSDVTEDNVLEYLTTAAQKGVFPLTPKELSEMWKLKKSLGSSLGQVSDEELKTAEAEPKKPAEDEEEEKKTKYQTGDVSLKDIGKELGGVTPTMINKLAGSAGEKMTKLTGGKHPEDLDDEELEGLLSRVQNARVSAAEQFSDMLKDSESVEGFLQSLVKNQILTPTDMKIIDSDELEGLKILMDKPKERIMLILMQDIEDDDNLFKTYQSAVSKTIFPPGKRGRPRKKKD